MMTMYLLTTSTATNVTDLLRSIATMTIPKKRSSRDFHRTDRNEANRQTKANRVWQAKPTAARTLMDVVMGISPKIIQTHTILEPVVNKIPLKIDDYNATTINTQTQSMFKCTFCIGTSASDVMASCLDRNCY